MSAVSEIGVVSEKRVLSFSRHPPSPTGASYVPQTVYQSRYHRGFAMNQYTQLQLCVEPHRDTSGIATSFHPLPSPVIIDKSFVGGTLSKRLSLAMRLARRDVLNGKLLSPHAAVYGNHSFQADSCISFPDKTIPDTTADKSSPHSHEYTHECTSTPSERLNHQCTSKPPDRLNHQCTSKPPNRLNHQCTSKPPDRLNHQHDSNVKCPPRLSPFQSTSSSREQSDLKKELQRQINVLKQLNGNKQTPVFQDNSLPPKVQATGGRVWMKVEERSEEREHRRMLERMARNSRLIYNLKQQVDSLQSDIDQLAGASAEEETQSAKMAKACIKLGATHRTAMRILANYQGSPSQQIPPALALLLLQLNLMSSKLGVCGEGNYELQQAVEQIKCLCNDPMPNVEKEARQTQTNSKQDKKMASKNRSHRQTGHKLMKGYSNTAHNHSTQRRHLRPPLHKSTPTTRVQQASTVSHRAPASHRGRKRSNKFSLKTSILTNRRTNQYTPPSPLTNEQTNQNTPSAPLTNQQTNQNTPPPPLTNQRTSQHTPPSPLTNQRTNQNTPPSPLTNRQTNLNTPPPLLTNQDKQTVVNHEQGQMVYPLSDLSCPSVSRPDSELLQSVTKTALSQKSQERVAIMLDRLQELESERDAIRERWSTIAYEDPLWNHTVLADATQELRAKDTVTRSPRGPCTLTPDDMLKSISTYKMRYSHYLSLTGLTSRGGFDPLTVAESVADSLLDEQVTAIAKEVEQVCNSCVDSLYGGEFAKPPTEIT